MFAKVFVLVCAIGAVLAHPYPEEYNYQPDLEPYASEQELEQPIPPLRLKRQVFAQGGGSAGQGFDLGVKAQVPVWQSDNGRHNIDAVGKYSQHLEGPYGNSRPNAFGGAVYSYHF